MDSEPEHNAARDDLELPSPGWADDAGTLRRQLVFRCWHRGTREADMILGSFADRHVTSFGLEELQALARLLERSDPDIYNWMTGREPVPPEHDTSVMTLLKEHAERGATA